MFPKRSGRFLAATLVVLALGADDDLKTHSVRGITFSTPKTWSEAKAGGMRLAQFKVEPAKGDEDPAELVLFAFPGGGGPVQANLDRWAAQFVDADGGAVKITTEVRKGKDAEVTFAQVSGRYIAAVTPGKAEKYDKPGWMLLGAIVQTDEIGYFFKMVGPEKTMKAAKPAFEAMIKSISVAGK